MSGFARLHPISIFLFYIMVIIGTVICTNPVISIISFMAAIIYRIVLKKAMVIKEILLYLGIVVITALFNMILSHNGQTVLFYLNDNRVTLEAAVYGFSSGIMIASVMAWCRSLSQDFTEDKILYLIGNISSDIALILSMVMRFIPLYKRQSVKVSEAYGVINDNENENIADRLKNKLRVYDSVLGFAIENSIDTADSMKARGYGCGKRTMFHRFSVNKTDIVYIVLIAVELFIYIFSIKNSTASYSFYPVIDKINMEKNYLIFYVSFAVMSAIPLIEEIKWRIKWKYLTSAI